MAGGEAPLRRALKMRRQIAQESRRPRVPRAISIWRVKRVPVSKIHSMPFHHHRAILCCPVRGSGFFGPR
jgi:hypothetical protein